MIRIAKEKAEASRVENVTFETRAVGDHQIPESSYDVILALNLLHLLQDPEATIAATYRGLKPGGVLVTSTACIGEMSWYVRLIPLLGGFLGLFPFVNVFTRAWLVQKHVDAGFEIDHEWLFERNTALFIAARK